jgi:hypothetical protein
MVNVPLEANACAPNAGIDTDDASVIEPVPLVIVMPVPAVSVALVSVLPVVLPIRSSPLV